MQKRNVLDSPRLLELRKKKKKIFVRKLIIFGILFLIILASLSLATRIERLNINEVQVEGNKVIDTEKIVNTTNQVTSGYYFWLFPKTNIFLYPKSKIISTLGDEYKRLTDIKVSISRQKINISVAERSPEYTWCGEILPTSNTEETCFFLDKEGYIFDQAPYFSGEVYFKFYGGLSDKNRKNNNDPTKEIDSPSGSYVAKGYFEKMVTLKNVLTDLDIRPVAIHVEDGENFKVFLSREKVLTNGPYIIIKKNADFQKVAENLKAALDTDPLKSRFKKEYSLLQYIDVRFGNKVYYKFR